MTTPLKAFLCAASSVILFSFGSPRAKHLASTATNPASPKIQVAILLDVSSSMDGLIEQAKMQLWNMVSVMGKAKCSTGQPGIEIALYEYGRSSNDSKTGYIRRLSPFTTDLDTLSQTLFSLTTYGGEEYCGQVIHTALDSLGWDADPLSYKVIFIAGNEDFLQGSVKFTQACAAAGKKGVIVNTIYCGPRAAGIREHWNLGAECGDGSFTVIDQNAEIEEIPTPYDSALIVLNTSLNRTYIGYGNDGNRKMEVMNAVDANNYKKSRSAGIKRVEVKSSNRTYNNASWDLVDAASADTTIFSTMALEQLPDTLREKSRDELKAFVSNKSNERTAIQRNIGDMSIKRNAWLAAERRNHVKTDAEATLETQIEGIIRLQARRFNMTID
jgi:hypothetical protein